MVDLIIIGGGAAGMAAAVSAREAGLEKVCIIETNDCLGGVLRQCIHNGFGLELYGKDFTGPEYAHLFMTQLDDLGVEVRLSTTVTSIEAQADGSYQVEMMGGDIGYGSLVAPSVIMATGCQERTRDNILMPGSRPAGLMTAGTAQRLVNIYGYKVGQEVVIVGSGDIGLIMARRLTLEGIKVKCVLEILKESRGLKRNIQQCLHDYDIPLYTSHRVLDVKGKERVSGILIGEIDDLGGITDGSKREIACDTLLLSVGLIPDTSLVEGLIDLNPKNNGVMVNDEMTSSRPGFYACGNVVKVHDLVDHVSEQGILVGKIAANYVQGLEA